jgi:hypothetical protein
MFESYSHQLAAGGIRTPWILEDTVCCSKEYQKGESERETGDSGMG